MRTKLLLFVFSLLSIVGWGQFTFTPISPTSVTAPQIDSKGWIESETKIIQSQAGNINPEVVKLSLTAYAKARHQNLDSKGLLTIVDYSKPSSERRLWVVDLRNHKVLFNTWVAHGKNSGAATSDSFSNQPSSLKSSLGVFVTSETYSGHKGYSLRLQGLERGINNNAYSRSIVFHGATYVNGDIAKHRGMVGRSWGCFAVGNDVIKPLINTIKNDTIVVAYYPDKNWLKNSTYVA